MKRTMCTAVLMAVAAVVLLGAGQVSGRPASPGQQYSITDLGALPGGENFTFATAINDRGQVVGQSGTASGESHGFLWENGQMTDLGALPGAVSSIALGINNRGQVVGQSTANFEQFHAFLWQDGKMTN
jgi:probable HAF family extracellular repeat protein